MSITLIPQAHIYSLLPGVGRSQTPPYPHPHSALIAPCFQISAMIHELDIYFQNVLCFLNVQVSHSFRNNYIVLKEKILCWFFNCWDELLPILEIISHRKIWLPQCIRYKIWQNLIILASTVWDYSHAPLLTSNTSSKPPCPWWIIHNHSKHDHDGELHISVQKF